MGTIIVEFAKSCSLSNKGVETNIVEFAKHLFPAGARFHSRRELIISLRMTSVIETLCGVSVENEARGLILATPIIQSNLEKTVFSLGTGHSSNNCCRADWFPV